MKFDTAVPHFNRGDVERPAAKQRRIGLQRLEIAANGDRFGDRGSVVENKRGEPLHRIDGGVSLTSVLQRADVDLFGRNANALLGQKYPHPARIGGAAAVIKFHRRRPLFYLVDTASLSCSLVTSLHSWPSCGPK
jgi:hypothetical protein